MKYFSLGVCLVVSRSILRSLVVNDAHFFCGMRSCLLILAAWWLDILYGFLAETEGRR